MAWCNRIFGLVTVAALVAVAAGCPPQPRLHVTPLAIHFDAGTDTATFRIINAGGGTLSWTITEDLPWLALQLDTLEKQGGPLSGSTTTEIEVVTARVNRSLLGPGTTQGRIAITSNGGDDELAVSVSQPSVPVLEVSETDIDLGVAGETAQFEVRNLGSAELEWSLSIPGSAGWLSAAPVSGTLPTTQSAGSVILTADRRGLAPGSYQTTVSISSNGGDAAVTVRMDVLALSLRPASIDAGAIREPVNSTLTLENAGGASVAWTGSVSSSFLSLTPASGTAGPNGLTPITLTIDPAGLAPGNYTGAVSVSSVPAVPGSPPDFMGTVSVSFRVSGFSVSTNVVNFGEIQQAEQRTFTITNTAPDAVDWRVVTSSGASAWLTVSPSSGSLTGTATITVTADPARVQPGTYGADLLVEHEGVTDLVTVAMSSVEPASLVVVPSFFDFDTAFVQRQMVIWNGGTGRVDWEIDTTGFPAWLSLSPVGGGGIASGSVADDENDVLLLRVDRSLAPADEFEFEHVFSVVPVAGASDAVDVTVQMRIPRVPELAFTADGVDEQGRPFVSIGTTSDQRAVIIRNTGNGPLFYSITGFDEVAWITSVAPSQGTLDPGRQAVPVIFVDRTTLDYRGGQHLLTLTTNDPDNPTVSFLVEVQVAKQVSIVRRPSSLAFGADESSAIVEIANGGDPDTVLDFQVSASKEWLSVFPEFGSSVGTASEFKDWQVFSVSVDRSQLEDSSAAGKLTITAFTTENGVRVPLPGVATIEVDITVEVPALTIESARPRLRKPSLVRTVLLLRNLRYQAIAIPAPLLDDVSSRLSVFENDQALEASEAGQFLAGPERIRGNILVVLDYSGSMFEAAGTVVEEDIANAADPLQAAYDQCIPQLLDEIPAQYRVALAVMNERTGEQPELGALRLIFPNDGAPLFTSDKSVLQARFDSILVRDHGATVLLPSMRRAALVLESDDANLGLIPFDDADVRAIICVTDGRLTTSSGFGITETAEFLAERHVRFMPIGWGGRVSTDPLVRMSVGTGGHFYATRNLPTGETDAFGNLLRVPEVAALQAWCEIDPADACSQSVGRDLAAQVIFSYATPGDEPSVNLKGRLTFNDPNDQNSPCIEEQGEISGSFTHRQLNYQEISNDPRLGQISLRTEGIQPDNTARVTMRLEYAPRNVDRLAFTVNVDSAQPYTLNVVSVPNSLGGAIPDWQIAPAGPEGASPHTLTFTAPAGETLRFGDFGDLVELRFSGVSLPFRVRFTVTDPVINAADPESKYITMPDSIQVGTAETLAPAFPLALIAASPALDEDEDGNLSIDLGSATPNAVIDFYNGGGSHSPTGVWLAWELNAEVNAELFTFAPEEGAVASTLTPDTITITPDRTGAPGLYFGVFVFAYNFGTLGYAFNSRPITVYYEVLPAGAEVPISALDFGAATLELPLTVRNTGQGTLGWSIDAPLLPLWLTVTRNAGSLGPGESQDLLVRVDRSRLSTGNYNHQFPILFSNGDEILVTVSMSVP